MADDFDIESAIDEIQSRSKIEAVNPLEHPRYDLFAEYRLGTSMGAIGCIILPSDCCQDQLDWYRNFHYESVSLEYGALSAMGLKQLQLRMFRHSVDEEDVKLLKTHSWFSDDLVVFPALTKCIRESVQAGESPLWNIVRTGFVPKHFADVLGEDLTGNGPCRQMIKEKVEIALDCNFVTVQELLSDMGGKPSPWVRFQKSSRFHKFGGAR
jgi:hypothetical protein